MFAAKEKVGVVGVIDPDAYAAATTTSGWVKADAFLRYIAIIAAGDIATNGTLDAKIEQATSAAGAGAKDVTSLAITQLTEAGPDSNKQVVIDIDPCDLDIANNFTHFRLSVTGAVAAADWGAVILGVEPVNGPATGFDAATVDEVVG